MKRNPRYDADLFLRTRWAAYVARRIEIAELLGEILAPISAPAEAQGPSLSDSAIANELGRCEAVIKPAASALLSGEGA